MIIFVNVMPNPESVMLNLFQHQGRLVIQHFKNHGLRDPETTHETSSGHGSG
jgi:hypothetical protein